MSSAGPEAIELAATAGLLLDPWQEFVLTGALGEDEFGLWSAFEVAVIVARQNGKGALIEARELAGLFLFGEQLIVHTAHEFKTAVEAFLRIQYLVKNCPDMERRVNKITTANGDEGIELLPLPTIIAGSSSQFVRLGKAQRLRFLARTGGAGRGFSGDTVILDEAYALPDPMMSALMPTMSAKPNPQLWYLSSPVDKEAHQFGVTLARIRERGMTGTDPSLLFAHWCADDEAYAAAEKARDLDEMARIAADPRQQAAANPGKGIRITEKYIANELRSLPARSFAVERLGIGYWPPTGDDADRVIKTKVWTAIAAEPHDAASQVSTDLIAVGIDVSPDRDSALSICGGREFDGIPQVEITDSRSGTGWVVGRARELKERWGPAVFLLDPAGPAGSLIPAFTDAGIELVLVTGREMAQACGAIYDAITAEDGQGLRHLNQPELNDAVAGARKRNLADAWAWHRRDSSINIAPLVAGTLAYHGYYVHSSKGNPWDQVY